MAPSTILIVDDDEASRNVLADRITAIGHTPVLAENGRVALTKMKEKPPDLVLLDILMPEMDGFAVLEHMKGDEDLRYLPVIVISALDDLESVVRCIEQGADDYLTKPFEPVLLKARIGNSLERYRLVKAERELLEQTLTGSVQALVDILSMTSPEAFGEAQGLRETVRDMARKMNVKDLWELEIAAMLHQIGLVTLPPELNLHLRDRENLSEVERNLLERVPQISHDLLKNIPRLESISSIILYQTKQYDGSGFPHDAIAGKDIPLGARVLKILGDISQLESSGRSVHDALAVMRERAGSYDPEVLEVIAAHYGEVFPPAPASAPSLEPALPLASRDSEPLAERPAAEALRHVENVSVNELKVGMVLAGELTTKDGHLLLSKGERITRALLARIRNYEDLKGIKLPIRVEVAKDA